MQGADCGLVKKLPRYPQLPVTLLGRLAIDEPRKGQGLGQFLLMDVLYMSLQAATAIAAIASLARHSRQVPQLPQRHRHWRQVGLLQTAGCQQFAQARNGRVMLAAPQRGLLVA